MVYAAVRRDRALVSPGDSRAIWRCGARARAWISIYRLVFPRYASAPPPWEIGRRALHAVVVVSWLLPLLAARRRQFFKERIYRLRKKPAKARGRGGRLSEELWLVDDFQRSRRRRADSAAHFRDMERRAADPIVSFRWTYASMCIRGYSCMCDFVSGCALCFRSNAGLCGIGALKLSSCGRLA